MLTFAAIAFLLAANPAAAAPESVRADSQPNIEESVDFDSGEEIVLEDDDMDFEDGDEIVFDEEETLDVQEIVFDDMEDMESEDSEQED